MTTFSVLVYIHSHSSLVYCGYKVDTLLLKFLYQQCSKFFTKFTWYPFAVQAALTVPNYMLKLLYTWQMVNNLWLESWLCRQFAYMTKYMLHDATYEKICRCFSATNAHVRVPLY